MPQLALHSQHRRRELVLPKRRSREYDKFEMYKNRPDQLKTLQLMMNHDDAGNDNDNYRKITCPEGPDTITLHVQKGQIPSHSTATCSRITSEISTSVLPLRTLRQRVRTVLASEVRGDTSNLISVFFPMRASHLRPVSAAHCVNINHQPTSRVRFELVCNCL